MLPVRVLDPRLGFGAGGGGGDGRLMPCLMVEAVD